jgi:N-acetylmuramoyl-L-alanine amidase
MPHTPRSPHRLGALASAALVASAALLAAPAAAHAQNARTLYQRTLSQEQSARAARTPSVDTLRRVASAYENLVRRYPTSGYCDNALWQAAGLMVAAYDRSGQAADRSRAEQYLRWLTREYPHSSLVRQVPERRRQLADAAPAASTDPPAAPPAARPETSPTGTAQLRSVTHSPLPRGDRITIELNREVAFRGDRVPDPDRVFFDLSSSAPGGSVASDAEDLRGRLVKSVRLGRHANNVSRVVLELDGTPRYSVYPLYDPFRLVIDVESDAIPVEPLPAAPAPEAPPLEAAVVPPPPPMPVAPSATASGDYSLARQLGLGVSRIVIDAGHGGHDPGAQANGIVEAELVLDIARRVEKLLTGRPGVQVVLTRSSNEYIPLEERTAIAKREDADLFLSIHANASRRTATRGVETYVLNFATNPEAEAVAARENASSSQNMRLLPSLLNAIALNDKKAESRELATIVQTNLVRRLRGADAGVKDLGVKQAPFVVLIGAQMPSVLVEISFITNRTEAALLKQNPYRDQIAQALADAVIKYQASLKKVTTVAERDQDR